MHTDVTFSASSIAAGILLAVSIPSFAGNNAQNAGTPVQPDALAAPAAAFTTKATVAYHYKGGFAPDQHKGVAAFSHPSTGIYCIQPSVALNLAKIYPLVSIEWDLSVGDSLLAYWKDTSYFSDCPAGQLEVTTYNFNGGGPAILSDYVAFSLVVE